MSWAQQRETVEQLYVHGHLDELFDDEGTSDDDLDDLAGAGFTARQIEAG